MRVKELAYEDPLCIEVSANFIEMCFRRDGWEERCAANTAHAFATRKRQLARLAALGRPAQTIHEAFAR